MATFEVQIEGITGLTIDTDTYPTQNQLSQYLLDGAKEVINALPKSLLPLCTQQTSFSSVAVESESSAYTVLNGKIIAVFGGNYQARRIPASRKHEANNSSSIHAASDSDPVFYMQNGYLNVLPTTVGTCRVDEVTYPTILFSEESISNFPDEVEYLVILFASMRALLNKIGSIEISPNTSSSAGTTETLTTDMQAITGNQLATDADFDDYDKWFVALGEMIEDDEDIELAGAQIEKINSYVNSWNVQLQGNSAEMQRYMALFQSVKSDYMSGIAMLQTGAIPTIPQLQQQSKQKPRR